MSVSIDYYNEKIAVKCKKVVHLHGGHTESSSAKNQEEEPSMITMIKIPFLAGQVQRQPFLMLPCLS